MQLERQPEEKYSIYYKDIEVEIKEIQFTHWFASVHKYQINITVYSKEYDIEESFYYYFQGAFVTLPECTDNKVGDIVKAELKYWAIDSTGEIIKKEIYQVY